MSKLTSSEYNYNGYGNNVPYLGKLTEAIKDGAASCIVCRSVSYPGEFGRVYFCGCGNEFLRCPKSMSLAEAIEKRVWGIKT